MAEHNISQNEKFLNLFWDLANPDPETHKSACVSLIKSIDQCQKKHSIKGEPCSELTYSMGRLIGGLSTTSRTGFFIALSQV
jgi:hypothetical protein